MIDAFGIYAVEACLLKSLRDIFRPEIVYGLDDVTLTKIAGESPESIAERGELDKKLKVLEGTLVTLQRWKRVTASRA